MAAHPRLKDEFTEDKKYHNFMTWLILESGVNARVHVLSIYQESKYVCATVFNNHHLDSIL